MRNFLLLVSGTMAILILIALNFNASSDPIVGRWAPSNDVVRMPIVHDTKQHLAFHSYFAPQEDRGPEHRRFLAASVKISVRGGSGSGTICYYDPLEKWAYVISCGHLWSGSRSSEELKKTPETCKITTWYHNDAKLDSPKTYDAEVLFWSNQRGYDSSCLRFKPDWIPDYFPIAPPDYPIKAGNRFHSCGCDGGREVARYDVEFVEFRGDDLITRINSPRPGRSGGGLLTNDGFYIAICWGTSDTTSGGGVGYFTPLKSIYKVYQKNGYEWLLNISPGGLAQKIPIFDRLNPNNHFDGDFIPIPRR